MSRTLRDLDRVPTLEELRAFFKENDFSTATYMDMDYDKLDSETVESLEYIKDLMDKHWEPLSREMGLKSDSGYYGDDNPLIALRDNVENLAAGGVMKLLEERPERAAEILAEFDFDDPDIAQHADDFLHNAVKTLMKTTDYEKMAEVVQGAPTYEDYNHSKQRNYRAKDFDRKWNHTRAQMQTTSLDALKEGCESDDTPMPDVLYDVVMNNISQETFWSKVTEDDRKILYLKMQGLTQAEIAERLGYKTHSAVTKRLQKLKELFLQCA